MQKLVARGQLNIVEDFDDFKTMSIEHLNKGIQVFKEHGGDAQYISDGFHNFKELYASRMAYNAALFNEWGKAKTWNDTTEEWESDPRYDVHKSWKHHDGEDCFGGGWFIVVAMLPSGQITNHYKAEFWDLFRIPEAPKAKYEWDGHTPKDVLDRLKDL